MAAFGALASAAALSCSGNRGGDPSARFFAVHNAMRAMGLSDLGAVSQGVLGEGQEVRLTEKLPAGCATFVALGGAGARDVALTLIDPDGHAIAKDDTQDAEAAMRACVDQPGAYVLVVKMEAGAGEYLVSSWSGGDRAPAVDAGTGPEIASGGSCDAPTPIVVGQTYVGDTEDGHDDNEGSCGNRGGREVVYRLDVASRARVTLDVNAQFDSLLYVRKADCGDPDAEIGCNDDAPGGTKRSKIDAVLEPGSYFVFVDGYGDESGAFRLRVTSQQAPSLADVCRDARPLAAGARLTARVDDAFDNVHASCGRGANGPDRAFRIDLPTRSRLRVTETSSDFPPVVHLRRACDDDATELACSDAEGAASVARVLDPGTYFVFADSSEEPTGGELAVEAETAPEAGGGAPGDACGDAQPLPAASASRVEGDTFQARDDFAPSCGGTGAPDVVYRIDVPHRSRLVARATSDAGDFVLALERSCGDRSTELQCGPTIDQVVPPGAYFLVVDGAKEGTLGKFSLAWKLRDMQALESACGGAPTIALGRPVAGTTANAGDRFTSGCARPDGSAPDRVYKLTLAKRTALRVTATGRGFSPVVSLRRDCVADRVEMKCDSGNDDTPATLEALLDPGTYYVVVDGASAGEEGSFTVAVEVVK